MAPITPDLDSYWTTLTAALPHLDADEQRIARMIYRQLAQGEPLSTERLAEALGTSPAEVEERLARPSLECLSYRDDDGRLAGFGGLATAPMHHGFEVEGRSLWTWCAWDSLFIPALLETTARVTSTDPRSGEEIRLLVTADGVRDVDPATAVVSFLQPDPSAFEESATQIMRTFCHFIYFFASRASGEEWAAEHPGTFLVSMEEAFELAQRLNERSFRLVRSGATAATGPLSR